MGIAPIKVSRTGAHAVSLVPGSEVDFRGTRFHITHIVDFENVVCRPAGGGKVEVLPIAQLSTPALAGSERPREDLAAFSDEALALAQKRLEIIRPLLIAPGRTRADVAARAKDYGFHTNTLYEWIGCYEATGRLSSLTRLPRSDRGRHRLTEEVEAVIHKTIEDTFLTPQRISAQRLCEEIRTKCVRAGLPQPHSATIRRRIGALGERIKLERRHGRRAARYRFEPVRGEFPGGEWPLAIVQIDHTKVDIVLVDDDLRRPVGKPWITLAIDVCSRMVPGFYVSFDPPGALSTGLCLVHAALPKEEWLIQHGVTGQWPCWGLPQTIHMDNDRGFRGQMLKRACDEYGVAIEFRPVATPHYGGHIERLLGTFAKRVHELPGTTFSNSQARGDYKSMDHAVMTLKEFETWLTRLIVEVYQQSFHDGIQTLPLQRWKAGIFGEDGLRGTGLPAKITAPERFRLDFMPFFERTIQEYGVQHEHVSYYADVLRPFVHAQEPGSRGAKRKFLFRYDPRDMSVIYFYDPEAKTYFAIHYRETARPAVSLWELREARREIERAGRKHVDERGLFEAVERLRAHVEASVTKTTAARRAKQRRADAARRVSHVEPPGTAPVSKPSEPEQTAVVPKRPPALPYDDLDEMVDTHG